MASPFGESTDVADCGIAVMAKASHAGQTKTRLVPPLTFEEAAECNSAFLRDVADNIVLASADASIAGYVAFGPPGTEPFFRRLVPCAIGLIEASYPTLGECLFSTICRLFERGHHNAVLVNSDSPTLPTALLIESARVLAWPGDRIVIGPATDGGYYLVGVKRKHHRLFQDIAWSTERVMQQTMERAGELDLPVHLLREWYDVDDVDSFKLLEEELFQGRSSGSDVRPGPARHTRALIRSLIENAGLQDRLADNALGRAAE
jgi:rSAM/selenodomain-associated transferase 1